MTYDCIRMCKQFLLCCHVSATLRTLYQYTTTSLHLFGQLVGGDYKRRNGITEQRNNGISEFAPMAYIICTL